MHDSLNFLIHIDLMMTFDRDVFICYGIIYMFR